MAVNGLVLVLVGAGLPLVVNVMLNRTYWSIEPTTFVLSLSVILYNLYFIFWTGANVAKQNRVIPLITLVASGVNVGLNFLLVPQYGMWAAAWTTVAGVGTLAFLVYFYSEHHYHIPFEWRRLILIAIGAGAGLAVVGGVADLTGVAVAMPLPALLWRTALEFLAVPTFVAVLWYGRFFNVRERRRLASALGSLGLHRLVVATRP